MDYNYHSPPVSIILLLNVLYTHTMSCIIVMDITMGHWAWCSYREVIQVCMHAHE